MRTILLIATGIFFYLLARPVWAGGGDETIDPRNGCYAKASTHSDSADLMADFVNKRGLYSMIVDDARFGTFTQCWEKKANCIRIPTVCRKDGDIVYRGFTWQSREVRK